MIGIDLYIAIYVYLLRKLGIAAPKAYEKEKLYFGSYYRIGPKRLEKNKNNKGHTSVKGCTSTVLYNKVI